MNDTSNVLICEPDYPALPIQDHLELLSETPKRTEGHVITHTRTLPTSTGIEMVYCVSA